MIPARHQDRHRESWREELAEAITDPAELLGALGLDPALLTPALAAAARFRLRVPQAFVRRMRYGDARDPLLRQVLPVGEELLDAEGYSGDPLGRRRRIPRPACCTSTTGARCSDHRRAP